MELARNTANKVGYHGTGKKKRRSSVGVPSPDGYQDYGKARGCHHNRPQASGRGSEAEGENLRAPAEGRGESGGGHGPTGERHRGSRLGGRGTAQGGRANRRRRRRILRRLAAIAEGDQSRLWPYHEGEGERGSFRLEDAGAADPDRGSHQPDLEFNLRHQQGGGAPGRLREDGGRA